MPLLKLETNQPIEDAHQLCTALSQNLSAALGKSEQYVMTSVQHNPHMSFAGTTDPLAYIELKSIGLPDDQTAQLSEQIGQWVEEMLPVPAARCYIEFSNVPRTHWGWNGKTFG